MPSKRHGYLTRKEWLAQRLEDARDRAGAFDVERLLRATRFYYNEFDYLLQIGESTPEDRAQRKSPPVTLLYNFEIEFPE